MLLIISLEFWLTRIGIGLPYHVLDTIVVLLITMILSYFTLVFGELVPKQIAIHKSEQMALGVSGLISGIAFLFFRLLKYLPGQQTQFSECLASIRIQMKKKSLKKK